MKYFCLLTVLAIGATVCSGGTVANEKPCKHPGFFAEADNSAKYYGCYANKYGGLTRKPLSCTTGQVFDARKGFCVQRAVNAAAAADSDDTESENPTIPPEVEKPTIPTLAPSSTTDGANVENPTIPPAATTTPSAVDEQETEEPEQEPTTPAAPEKPVETTTKPEETTEQPEEDTTTIKADDVTTEEADTTTSVPETTTAKPEENEPTTEGAVETETTEKPEENDTTTEGAVTEPTETPEENEPTTEAPEENETTTEVVETKPTETPEENDTTTEGAVTEPTQTPEENETTTEAAETEPTETPAENETTTEVGDTETTSDPEETETTTEQDNETTTDVPHPEFICPTNGFFPQDGSCDKFNYCTVVDGEMKAFQRVCPEGQNYFPSGGYCTASYKCDAVNPAQATKLDHFQCEVEGTFVYNTDCSRYYKCTWNQRTNNFRSHVLQCPQGQVYNILSGECDSEGIHTCLGRPQNSKYASQSP